MAAHEGIAGNLLFQLAEDIETGEQMEALGRALGFKAAAINRYTDTNNKGDRVTCKGTCDMLFDWRQTIKPCDQHLRLEQALIDAKLVMLADTHLKGTSSIPGRSISANVLTITSFTRKSFEDRSISCSFSLCISVPLIFVCKTSLKKRRK